MGHRITLESKSCYLVDGKDLELMPHIFPGNK